MTNFIKNFRNDENGAVTVDWVVLTAAVVGLAVAAYSAINTNAATLIGTAATEVGSQSASSLKTTYTSAASGS